MLCYFPLSSQKTSEKSEEKSFQSAQKKPILIKDIHETQ